MAKQILVPLGRGDRVEEIIPYVESVAQPGMNVVFLMRYPLYGFIWPRKDSGIEAALEARKIAAYYTSEEQKRLAENKVSLAREALEKQGVEVTVDVYTESLREAVRSYTAKGDVHLIMTHAGIGHWVTRLLTGTVAFLRVFERLSPSPVLIFRPRTFP